ncbi:MAG: cation diffusion facilitator family transporter [Flavobacteriales bacterium]
MKININLTKQNALLWSICINVIAMIIEFYYAEITKSVMLFSDAIHMLSHVASLLVSYIAILLATRLKNGEYYENLAALINGIGLLVFTGFIFQEAYIHMLHPNTITLGMAFYTAIFGLVINLLTAFILSKSGVEDINTKSAFLHMLSDTFSSVSIILGLIIIYYTNWLWIDVVLSVVVGIVVGKWSFGLIKDSIKNLRRLRKKIHYISNIQEMV